jgi:hypothetical protein
MATLNEKTTPKRTDNMLTECEKALVEACQAGPLKSLDPTSKTVRVLSDIILRMNKELQENDIKIQALKEVLREDEISLRAPSISETFEKFDRFNDQFESDFGITR